MAGAQRTSRLLVRVRLVAHPTGRPGRHSQRFGGAELTPRLLGDLETGELLPHGHETVLVGAHGRVVGVHRGLEPATGTPEVVAEETGISRNAVIVAKCRVLSRLRQESEGLIESSSVLFAKS